MNDIIYCCVMTDRSEFKDASPELLSALGYDFSSWKDEETKEIKHTLYFSNEKDSVDAMNTLMAKEEEFNSFGIRFTDFSCTKLKKEDWAEVWKIHFKPLVISDTLAITPTWEHFEPKPGQVLIKLDPGMSFGTGQHATTKSCLASIDGVAGKRAERDCHAGCRFRFRNSRNRGAQTRMYACRCV